MLLISVLIYCSGCRKDNITYNFDYKIVQQADLTNLLMFYDGPNIIGLDTTDFTIKAQIRVDDMSFGGVAKLPSGGVAFTYSRRASNDGWGSLLYVTDRNCNLVNRYKICYSPMGPKVVNNLLMVGSSEIESGVKFKFQIYNTDNYSLLKEFQFEDMADSYQITAWNNDIYFGVNPTGFFENNNYHPKNGYIVQLDLSTFDTTLIMKNDTNLLDAYSTVYRQDSLLYIFKTIQKKIFVYNFSTKSVTHIAKVNEYPEVVKINALRISSPYYKDGYLYGFFENDGYYNQQTYWAKFNASTLELISLKQVNSPGDYGYAEFYAGSYFVMQFYNHYVSFVDIKTGVVKNSFIFKVKGY